MNDNVHDLPRRPRGPLTDLIEGVQEAHDRAEEVWRSIDAEDPHLVGLLGAGAARELDDHLTDAVVGLESALALLVPEKDES
jgi:hypothetical protein